MSFGSVSVRSDEDLPSLRGEEWLERIRSAIRDGSHLKDYGPDASTRTYRMEFERGVSACLKEYRLNRGRKFLSLFRQSRAERVWWMSKQLLSCGCEVPRPLLHVERHRVGVLQESYLATEWLDGRISLADWYRSKKASAEDNGDREIEAKVLEAVRSAADFHRYGAIHGDMKWSNFLIPVDGEGEIVLVDLDAARFESGPTVRGKDLARFAISALEEGLSSEMIGRIHEEYCRVLQQAQAERNRKAYEGYVRKRVPRFFRRP